METVAKILGHSSTKITRSTYAKLLDDTVAKEMIRAESKLPSASSSL
jgi:integrase